MRDAGESGVYDSGRGDPWSCVMVMGREGFMYIDCCDSTVR